MERVHHHAAPHRRSAPPPSRTSRLGGLPAALTLTLVAFSDVSVGLGLAFLLAFLAWGAACLPAAARGAAPAAAPEQVHRAAVAAKRLWAAVAGLSALGLLAQLVVQAAFALGAPGLGAAAPFLRLLGFPQAQDVGGALKVRARGHMGRHGCVARVLCCRWRHPRHPQHSPLLRCRVQAIMPLLLALLASAAQVQAARDVGSQQRQRQAEGTELQPLGAGRGSVQPGGPQAASWVAAAALLTAALARPSVAAAPFMLAAAAALWRVSGGGGSGGTGMRRTAALVQPYTAVLLLVLYVYSATLGGWARVQPLADLLGLFSLDDAGPSGVLLLVALLLLFVALGAAADDAGGGSAAWHGPAAAAPAPSDAWEAGGEQAPLLQHDRQAMPPAAPARQHPTRGISMQQLVQLLLLDTAEVLCREPPAVAALLCGCALVQPSLLGGLVLLWGLAALLATPAAAALQRWSRALTAALLVSCPPAALDAWLATATNSTDPVPAHAHPCPTPGMAARLLRRVGGGCPGQHACRIPGAGPAASQHALAAARHPGIGGSHRWAGMEQPGPPQQA